MHACGSEASEQEVLTDKEALINGNFQNKMYLCLNKRLRALTWAGG